MKFPSPRWWCKAAEEWFSFPVQWTARCFTWQRTRPRLNDQQQQQHALQFHLAWLERLAGASTHLSSNQLPKMSASMASLCLGLKRNSETSPGECSSGSQSPSSPGDRKARWICSYTYDSALKSNQEKKKKTFSWASCGLEMFFLRQRCKEDAFTEELLWLHFHTEYKPKKSVFFCLYWMFFIPLKDGFCQCVVIITPELVSALCFSIFFKNEFAHLKEIQRLNVTKGPELKIIKIRH